MDKPPGSRAWAEAALRRQKNGGVNPPLQKKGQYFEGAPQNFSNPNI